MCLVFYYRIPQIRLLNEATVFVCLFIGFLPSVLFMQESAFFEEMNFQAVKCQEIVRRDELFLFFVRIISFEGIDLMLDFHVYDEDEQITFKMEFLAYGTFLDFFVLSDEFVLCNYSEFFNFA